MAPGKPESHLLKENRTLEAGKMGVWPLREQLDRMYQTYVAICRRIRKVPVITEQSVVGIYLPYLPEDLAAQVRDLASDTDLEQPPSSPPLEKTAAPPILYYRTPGASREPTGM